MPKYSYSAEIKIEDDPWVHVEMNVQADNHIRASEFFGNVLSYPPYYKVSNPQIMEIKNV